MSVDLRVDWCSYEAAKYAVKHWHYSRTMPTGKTAKIGVWENDSFVGAVLFSWGSNRHIGSEFGLTMMQACELVRVALMAHKAQTSRIVAKSINLLKQKSPGVRLVVSLADPYCGHVGTLYQAGNWLYTGYASGDKRVQRYERNGVIRHWRTVAQELHDKGLTSTEKDASRLGYKPLGHVPKHRYLYPLDRAIRKQIEPLRKPYPKRETCGPSVEGDTLPQAESSVRSAGAALNSDLL